MNRYVVMPEDGRWFEIEATTPEMAYRGCCSYVMPSTRTAILDPVTKHVDVYTRRLDRHGNLIAVNREV